MHILIATDGSDRALEAAQAGVTLLGAPTKVTILSVAADIPTDVGGGHAGPLYTPEQTEELRLAESDQAARTLAATQVIVQPVVDQRATVEQRVEIGDPAKTICRIAEDLDVDVIVIGSQGKGFVSRMFLGSVSEHVARNAPCPVLIVRAPDKAS